MGLRIGPGAMVAAAFIGPGTITTASVAGATTGITLILGDCFFSIGDGTAAGTCGAKCFDDGS